MTKQKSLNSGIFKSLYIMNKRGQIIELGAIVLIVLTTIGVYATVYASQNLYVGNLRTHKFLNYFECKDIANSIPQANLIMFNSKQEAINQNYNVTEGCT